MGRLFFGVRVCCGSFGGIRVWIVRGILFRLVGFLQCWGGTRDLREVWVLPRENAGSGFGEGVQKLPYAVSNVWSVFELAG